MVSGTMTIHPRFVQFIIFTKKISQHFDEKPFISFQNSIKKKYTLVLYVFEKETFFKHFYVRIWSSRALKLYFEICMTSLHERQLLKSMLLLPSSSQFVKKFYVQSLVGIFTPHRQENISPNEFMDNFAVGRQALKYDTFSIT